MTKLLRTICVLTIISQLFTNCSQTENQHKIDLKSGIWRGVINIQQQELPFNFEVIINQQNYSINLINDTERILLDSLVLFSTDSLKIPLHIFDADLIVKSYGDSIAGYWVKNYAKNYKIPFYAKQGVTHRFKTTPNNNPTYNFTGKYNATFVHNNIDTVKAIGIFKQDNERVTGTFLTSTGDYRFLEGSASGNELYLSTFDGGHAFLFKAQSQGNGEIIGEYWSGKTWYEPWYAIKNNDAELDKTPSTYLKEGYDEVNFKFPDLNGKLVSPKDEKYQNKIVILQLFGTWCPNCMDETKYLASWYDRNHKRGIEIIGLSYEVNDSYEYAKSRINKMKNKLNVNYDYVVAGISDKDAASKTLPMLNQVSAFPSLIIIDKKGKVRNIHTGFSGPGTGDNYDHFIKEFNSIIDNLIME